MAKAKIPFVSPLDKNVDQITLSNRVVDMIDCYIDEGGFANRRPGLEEFADLSSSKPVDGLFYWDEKELTIAVSGGTVYSISKFAAVNTIGSGMNVNQKVTFTTARLSGLDTLVMANGGAMFRTDGITLTQISDPDAPQVVTHVAFLDKYLIANRVGSAEWHFSELNDPDTWSALDVTESEQKPDDVSAIYVVGREIITFGFRSIEFFYNDGSSPFRRFEGGEKLRGLLAPLSVAIIGADVFFIDETRRVIRMRGREQQSISGAIDNEIQKLTDVSDALGSILEVGGKNFYVLNFPDGDKTFVYDYNQNLWYQWGEWDEANTVYKQFKGNVFAHDIKNKRFLCGDKSNGKVYELKLDEYQDDGDEIRSLIRTGYIDHGTHNRKRNIKLTLRMKRGIAKDASDNAGEVNIKYRDEDERDFGTERSVSTGKSGDSRFVIELFSNGVYRSRQYEIVSTDNTPFIIGDFEEDFTVQRT